MNQTWLKGHHIRRWRSEFGVSDEIEDHTDTILLNILNGLDTSSIGKDPILNPKTPSDQLVLLSHIWKNRTVQNEEAYLRVCLNELMVTNTQQIARVFGWMCRSRIPTLLMLVGQEEVTPPYYVRASLTPGGLSLPLNYYLYSTKLKDTEIWKAYVDYVTLCSVELGLPFLRYAIEAEESLAKQLDSPFTDIIKRSKGSNLVKWIPEFEWSAFMEGLNIDNGWQSRLWVLDSPERLNRVIDWICKADTQHVVAVFALHLITFAAPYLRPAIKDASLLFNKALRGVSVEIPRTQQYLSDMKAILPDALCQLYSDTQHDTAKVDDIRELVTMLKGAAIQTMESTRILSKRAKIAAKEKIHRMRFIIGKNSAEILLNAKYFTESLIHTIISIQGARSSTISELAGKPSHPDNEYPCFQANASYYSESNHIVMPWGILQWPFYSSGKLNQSPLGWNYGGIGATIAHEMIHGFDLEGSMYSPRGVYKETWTRKNRIAFKKRTRRVGVFFGKFKHYGLHLDTTKTVSEDWADFGGLTIALRGLKNVLDSEKCSPAVIKEAYRNFFISYAVSWRTLVRKEKMIYAIMTSVHAPAEDRVDRIVPQFQEWVDAFDVREDNALYIPRGDRLKFF